LIGRANHMQRQARKRRIIGFGAIVAIALMFAGMGATSFSTASKRRAADALQVHTFEVLLAAGRFGTAVNETARGERGYLITGQRAYLEPYFRGRMQAVQQLRRLRNLTRDNARQQSNLLAVGRQLDAYLSRTDPIVMAELRNAANGPSTSLHDLGRTEITGLLANLDRVEAEEQRLLVLRHAASLRADRLSEINEWLILSLGAVLIALLTAAMASASRAHRQAIDLAEELHNLAITDELTGLPNRRQLMFAMETEVRRASRTGQPLSLALLDIDRFKRINDTHGHPAGDAVLRAVSDELRRVSRGGDVLGRFGGEEFAIVMPNTTVSQAKRACERLRKAVAAHVVHYPDGTTGSVTISSGVALLAGGEGCDHLVSRADGALYEAKADGRNLVRLAA